MSEPRDEQTPLVVLIDDEEDITTFLGLALEDAGYRVKTINDAREALAILRNEPPDLICLDLLMPRQTGASLYREILQDPDLAGAPVLILSGLNAGDELDEILQTDPGEAVPAGYLEKPIAREAFLAAVESLLGRQGEAEDEGSRS